MTSAAIIFLLLFCAFLVGGCWFVDSCIPTEAEEQRQARQDVEDMLRRANEEQANRPRVRAGTRI